MRAWELFYRFALTSLLAFGGGAGIPLIERVAVREAGWIGEREFTMAIGCGQVVPGPVMIVATFIGYRVAGPVGAFAATLGVFLIPSVLAAVAARQIGRPSRHRWARGFRQGASAAAFGLFGVTALALSRQVLVGRGSLLVAVAAFAIALWTRVHPVWILLGGALLGMLIDSSPPSPPVT